VKHARENNFSEEDFVVRILRTTVRVYKSLGLVVEVFVVSCEGFLGWEILEAIGRKRGFLMRGGEIDYNRSAVIVADEFRGGKLGRMTLELPE
jgi:ribosome biogenesis GTPase A